MSRFVYLDETGTGDINAEPWILMAGVMVHNDMRWKAVERYLQELADNFALPEDRFGFFFHARDLFTGGKQEFRDKYPLEKRHAALAALCAIAEKFSLPVFMYAINRPDYIAKYGAGKKPNDIITEQLMHLSAACATGIEGYMRTRAEPDEVATLVYEQNGDKDEHIRTYHNFFRTDYAAAALREVKNPRLLRFERIIETAFQVEKTDSSLLQIADACAYVLSCKMRGAGLEDRFYAPVRRQVVFGHRAILPNGLANFREVLGL